MDSSVFELLRHFVELARQVADLGAGGPVEALGEAALRERQQAEVEHLQHLVARRLRVVVTLDHAALGDGAVGVEQVTDGLRHVAPAVLLVFLARHAELVERLAAERIEDEHAVMRGDRAPRFADDHRVRDLARVAHAARCGTPRRWRTRSACSSSTKEIRAAAVVVDAQAAADVDVLQASA